MQSAGRIAGDEGAHLSNWKPEEALYRLTQGEARFSRGFLSANPQLWFASLAEHWLPLFHTLSAEVEVAGYEMAIGFPENLYRETVFGIDGEFAVLGYDQNTVDNIAGVVAPQLDASASSIVIEYLERRLLTTLTRSWTGTEALNCSFLGADYANAELNVLGSLCVQLKVGGSPATIWFGIGPQLVERLDVMWRASFLHHQREEGVQLSSDQIHSASIELTELAVPPALLIDYIRGGTVIDLERSVSSDVQVRMGDDIWARGELQNFNGRFAVRLKEFDPKPLDLPEATTRVRIELASVDLDAESIAEHRQKGAILISDAPVAAKASLIISGEHVANAVIGVIDGRYALTVLAR